MATTKIIDHVDRAIARLPGKLREKPKLDALLRALVRPAESLEDAFWQLYTERTVDNATGVTLDAIGNLVGEPRNGLSDEDYRRIIRAKISVNRSKGKREDIITITRAVLNHSNGTVVIVYDEFGGAVVQITGVITENDIANVLIRMLRVSVIGGARIVLETYLDVDAEMFTFAIAAFANAPLTIGMTTLIVNSTAGFPAVGSLIIDSYLTVQETVTYTGITSTSFLGVSPLASNHVANSTIQLATGPGKGFGSVDSNIGGRFASARDNVADDVVPSDGPLEVFLPQTLYQFHSLGIQVPDYLFLCQELSGNLLPTFGDPSVQLAPTASPLYNQTVPGWTRKFVGIVLDVIGQRFSTTSALLDLAAGESYAMITYMSTSVAGSPRRLMSVQSGNDSMRTEVNGTILTFHNGQNATLLGDHSDIDTVHPFVWYRDALQNISGDRSDIADATVTHSELARTGQTKGIGASAAELPAESRATYIMIYKGTRAENIDWENYLERLGWTSDEPPYIVGSDGPGNVFVPTVPADWTALNLPTPSNVWLCQETSGNLADSVGGITLTSSGAVSYSNTLAGWARTFVGTTGTADGFRTTTASLDIALNESFACLLYLSVASQSTVSTIHLTGTNNAARISSNASGGQAQAFLGGSAVNGLTTHNDLTVARPWLYGRNITGGISRLFTNIEEISATHSTSAISGTKGIGNPTSGAATTRVAAIWFWRGAAAETILDKTTLSTLGWSIPY